jgi:hypothetical protein
MSIAEDTEPNRDPSLGGAYTIRMPEAEAKPDYIANHFKGLVLMYR